MLWKLGKWSVKTYAALLGIALGGLVGANLSGLIGIFLFASENKAERVLPWIQGGWYVGIILAFISTVLGKYRFQSGPGFEGNNPESAHSDSTSGEAESDDSKNDNEKKKSSILGAAGFLGVIGGVIGSIFGCSLLVFWFSLAYSPFAPESMSSSVEVKKERIVASGQQRHVMTTNHPIALFLVGIPALLGAGTGVVGGGVGTALGKVHDG